MNIIIEEAISILQSIKSLRSVTKVNSSLQLYIKIFKTKLMSLYQINNEIINLYENHESTIEYFNKKILKISAKEYTTAEDLVEDVEDIYDLIEMDAYRKTHYLKLDYNLFEKVSSEIINNIIKNNCSLRSGANILSLNAPYESIAQNNSLHKVYAISKTRPDTIPENLIVKLGSITDIRASNDSFDVLVLSPNISINNTVESLNGYTFRDEKGQIKSNLKYLKQDGVFILAMHKYKIHYDIAFIISKALSEVSIIEDPDTNYVYIFGRKNPLRYADADINTDIFNLFNPYQESFNYDMDTNYRVASEPLEIKVFKGGEISINDANELFKSSTLYEKANEHFTKTESLFERSPLLPLNSGQLGLLLASGCFNGEIEEGNGYKHLIKGRVFKHESNVDDGVVVAKKSSISLLRADGEHIKLI